MLEGKCNYTYISNTIATYYSEPEAVQTDKGSVSNDTVKGAYKDDDTKYSLKNLLKRQEQEGRHEI